MKLFQHSQGFIIAFGFDMINRKPDINMISWCDPSTGEWEATVKNMAGFTKTRFSVTPEFILEHEGKVIAFQSGRCLEMQYIGAPLVWSIRSLEGDHPQLLRVA